MSSTAVNPTRRLLSHLPQLAEENTNLLHWHYSSQLEADDRNFQVHGHTLFYLFILFSLILFITLLLLYARWYFRFRHQQTAVSEYHARHAPPSEFRGLDMAVINAMPILLHQESAVEREDEMECCICLGVFEDGDKVKVLSKCQHRFHSDCVDRWLLTQSSCPLCRVSLRVDPPPPISDSAIDISVS